MIDQAAVRQRYKVLAGVADERVRRLMLAAESLAIGRGGQVAVARATGVSRAMIQRGIREVLQPELQAPKGRIRRPGGGRKAMVVIDPTLRDDLERLVEPTSRGDPESPLRWTCKSVRKLAAELTARGHQTSHRMVADLLHDLGYSLQANQKTLEGSQHPDRKPRGKPLVSHEVVVNLIGATTTTTGLTVKSELDINQYPAGRIVSDAELSAIHIRREAFHGDWNYALLPRPGLL